MARATTLSVRTARTTQQVAVWTWTRGRGPEVVEPPPRVGAVGTGRSSLGDAIATPSFTRTSDARRGVLSTRGRGTAPIDTRRSRGTCLGRATTATRSGRPSARRPVLPGTSTRTPGVTCSPRCRRRRRPRRRRLPGTSAPSTATPRDPRG